MSLGLPEHLYSLVQARLNLVPLSTVKAGYEALSRDYRFLTVSEGQREDLPKVAGTGSGSLAGGDTKAQARVLGYLAARLPATFAAVSAAFSQVPDAVLAGCESALDLGAGPGTATWALHHRWPALKSAVLVEADPDMLREAEALAVAFPGLQVTQRAGDLVAELRHAKPADIVVMAYVLSETDESGQESLLKEAWAKAQRGLFLLEPGTPAASRRVLAARRQWATYGGALVAPCPQAGHCPLEDTGTVSWCHFAVRLERRGLHRAVKGGDLGYEDEKYSWLYFSKDKAQRPAAPFRLHSDPRRVNRNINLDVCDSEGRRRKLFYKRRETPFALRMAARRLQWGDAWDPSAPIVQAAPDEVNDGE